MKKKKVLMHHSGAPESNETDTYWGERYPVCSLHIRAGLIEIRFDIVQNRDFFLFNT